MNGMKKYSCVALVALVFFGFAAMQQPGRAQQQEAARTLQVKLRYTGAGTVDTKHKIYLFLFDSPDVVKDTTIMPIADGTGAAKDAMVTFAGVPVSPVYLVAVYDPTGAYDGMSRPQPGVSIALYGKTPGELEPVKIEPGKTVQIDLAFDDSMKLQ